MFFNTKRFPSNFQNHGNRGDLHEIVIWCISLYDRSYGYTVIVYTVCCVGGLIARQMGLPIKLVCAVNSNNIVDRAFSRGDYSISGDVIETLATAMNIQVRYLCHDYTDIYSPKLRWFICDFTLTYLLPNTLNRVCQ